MKIIRDSNILCFLIVILLILIKSSQQAVYSCNTSASCGCSTNSAVVTRIVGGEFASSATWGWAVSILIHGQYLCGGSIISNSWVITAAHCVSGFKASQITVYAGSTSLLSGTQVRVGSYIIAHPNYKAATLLNDIALVKLSSPFDMNDPYISKICVPTVNSSILSVEEWPAVNTSVVAVGWGRLNESGSIPSKLQQVTVQTVAYNTSTCTPVITDWYVQLCAGVIGGGKDTCNGDSGGPLMMFSLNNQWILIGITSGGIGCARPNSSGLYTRVASFQDWITTTMDGTYDHQISIYQSSFFLLSLSLFITVSQMYNQEYFLL